MQLTGSMVALVTPMLADGSIDTQAFCDLIEWHIASHTDALIIAGTTGESATLSAQEQYELVSLAIKQVNKRIPVIAGTGSNSTAVSVTLSEQAKKAGADACLIVTPYYNKPTQQGLYEHYNYIANHVAMPIILYNVPGRTGCDLQPETVERLAKIKSIVAIKEATGKLERAKDIMQRCEKSFFVYSGDDASALNLMLHGAKGVISVTANVAPTLMHEMCHHVLTNHPDLAEKINQKLALLHERLFVESNPIPTKWALHEMGKIQNHLRLPLLPLSSPYHQTVKEAMQHAGVY